ncbi:hypothetical protein [Catenuloplanes japonicus]|uniref:hypothetical protein n=1 Tax=Catenuloplanes japonicus TaxID=33876 RepID=UPI0012FA12AA|nr:hypothetical protein [Catenuloplanes japonicus]
MTTGAVCEDADAALNRGLAGTAEQLYRSHLPKASSADTVSPVSTSPVVIPACITVGLEAVRTRRVEARAAIAAGDRARETGRYGLARQWYLKAQRWDVDSEQAVTGLTSLARIERTQGSAALSDVWLPLAGRLIADLATILVVIFVAVRVVANFVVPPRTKKDPMSTRHAWLATSMVFIGALVFAIARAGYLRTTDTGFRILISSGIAILCGTFLLALWSGRRLAVQVEVRTEQEEANTSATAYLAARLAGLGGGRPEGLLRLKGTDVTALPADAIGELPPGRFAQALIKLTLALVPVVPWRIVATEGPGGVVTVDIRRNYRSVELILICPSDISAPDDDRETRRQAMLTATAAKTLLCLGEYYPQLTDGLCGATRWRSLARQVLATEPVDTPPTHRRRLLAEAVEADPGNLAAWYAYLVWTAVDEPEAVGAGRGAAVRFDALYLTATAEQRVSDGYLALIVRILYSSTAAWLQHWQALPTGSAEARNAWRHAAASSHAMTTTVARALNGQPRGLKEFATDVLPLTTDLAENFHSDDRGTNTCPWLDDAEIHLQSLLSRSLSALYVHACKCVRAGRRPEALDALGLAIGLDRQRAGAQRDPAFSPIAKTTQFRKLTLTDLPSSRRQRLFRFVSRTRIDTSG